MAPADDFELVLEPDAIDPDHDFDHDHDLDLDAAELEYLSWHALRGRHVHPRPGYAGPVPTVLHYGPAAAAGACDCADCRAGR